MKYIVSFWALAMKYDGNVSQFCLGFRQGRKKKKYIKIIKIKIIEW